MRKLFEIIMIPFAIFVVVVIAVVGFQFLLFATTAVAGILVGIAKYAVNGFPSDLGSLFSNPIRILALPIAIGLMIALGYWALNHMNQGSDNFVRGRQMGERTQRGLRRRSNRPSAQGSERRTLPEPSTRPNRRRRG